jgi:hypothetical protein
MKATRARGEEADTLGDGSVTAELNASHILQHIVDKILLVLGVLRRIGVGRILAGLDGLRTHFSFWVRAALREVTEESTSRGAGRFERGNGDATHSTAHAWVRGRREGS